MAIKISKSEGNPKIEKLAAQKAAEIEKISRKISENATERKKLEKAERPKRERIKLSPLELDALTESRRQQRKVPVTMRLDPEIVDWFRDSGMGWMTRINQILLSYIQARKGRQE